MLSIATIQTLVRFAAVGATVMVFFMGANALLTPELGEQWAFLVAYPPAVALHFCLSKWWTFGCHRRDAARQVSEYIAMVLVTFVVQWLVFTVLVSTSSIPSWLAAGCANAAQMVLTFLIMQRRVFAGERRGDAQK